MALKWITDAAEEGEYVLLYEGDIVSKETEVKSKVRVVG